MMLPPPQLAHKLAALRNEALRAERMARKSPGDAIRGLNRNRLSVPLLPEPHVRRASSTKIILISQEPAVGLNLPPRFRFGT
jgi:hypothetical protein